MNISFNIQVPNLEVNSKKLRGPNEKCCFARVHQMQDFLEFLASPTVLGTHLSARALVKRGALASRFAFPCCAEAMVPFLCMLMKRKLGLADSQRLLFFCFCFYLCSEGFSENWESVRDAQTLGGECFAPHLHFARQSEVPQV